MNDPTKPLESDKQVVNRPGQFQPGQSGNPNGRPPKGYSVTETIREMMDENPEIKKALGAKIFQMALNGDITAIKTIWNYLDGMPRESVDLNAMITVPHVRVDTKQEEAK